ncbi:MAG: DUF1080 domain-containing protein [Opitutae bacterium]
MRKLFSAVIVPLALLAACLHSAELEEGFVPLMDGKTFTGWKPTVEHADTWKIEDGAFVTRGPRAHLFYTGDDRPFKNFELKVEVMTEPGSNGGIYFHTRYQDTDWPRAGFECQVNVTQGDWIKTGSIYAVANTGLVNVVDGKWWTQHIIVLGNTVTVLINDQKVVQYTEPPGAKAGETFERKLGAGTFGLQAHDPKSVVRYRNIRVKRLPD